MTPSVRTDLLHDLMEQMGGVPHGAVDQIAESARAAGLEVVAVNGNFAAVDPQLGFDLHASTAAAIRERAVTLNTGVENQIDQLVNDLRAAKSGDYKWVSIPFHLDLALRKPLAP